MELRVQPSQLACPALACTLARCFTAPPRHAAWLLCCHATSGATPARGPAAAAERTNKSRHYSYTIARRDQAEGRQGSAAWRSGQGKPTTPHHATPPASPHLAVHGSVPPPTVFSSCFCFPPPPSFGACRVSIPILHRYPNRGSKGSRFEVVLPRRCWLNPEAPLSRVVTKSVPSISLQNILVSSRLD